MSTGVWDRILKSFAPSLRRESYKKRETSMQRLLPFCPVCGGEILGHHHWRLASVILDPKKDKADQIAQLIAAHQWEKAAQFQDWRSDRDELEYFFIRCPNQSNIGLASIVSTSDMWTDDHLDSTTKLDEKETNAILDLVGNGWNPC